MSLANALDQIQRQSWWNEPPEPWKSNRNAREQSASVRKDIENMISSTDGPVLVRDMAKQIGVPLMTVRNLCSQLVTSGFATRVYFQGMAAMAKAGYIPKTVDIRGDINRAKIIDALTKNGPMSKRELESIMGKSSGAVRYYINQMTDLKMIRKSAHKAKYRTDLFEIDGDKA